MMDNRRSRHFVNVMGNVPHVQNYCQLLRTCGGAIVGLEIVPELQRRTVVRLDVRHPCLLSANCDSRRVIRTRVLL